MEARYAELQSLHSAVLEEKRQLAASRGRPSRASAAANGATLRGRRRDARGGAGELGRLLAALGAEWRGMSDAEKAKYK